MKNLTLDEDVDENKENAGVKNETSDSGPMEKRRPSSCLFVASLKMTRSDDELCRLVTKRFEQYGKLLSVKVLRDTSGRPYAFVQYATDENCKHAILAANNTEMDGRLLRCEAAKVNRTLFLLSHNLLPISTVRRLMSQYGEIELVLASTEDGKVLHEAKSSCKWYIKFAYRDEAIRAFASLTDHESYQVEWAQNVDDTRRKIGAFDKCSIFVGALTPAVTEQNLVDHFSTHGRVTEVSIIHKPTSSFAFVTFDDEAAAACAVSRDNHSMFMDKTINVRYRELYGQGPARAILSPKVPVVLAPPPISLRKKKVDRPLKSEFSMGAASQLAISSRPRDLGRPRSFAASKDYASDRAQKATTPSKSGPEGVVTSARSFARVAQEAAKKSEKPKSCYYIIPKAR